MLLLVSPPLAPAICLSATRAYTEGPPRACRMVSAHHWPAAVPFSSAPLLSTDMAASNATLPVPISTSCKQSDTGGQRQEAVKRGGGTHGRIERHAAREHLHLLQAARHKQQSDSSKPSQPPRSRAA